MFPRPCPSPLPISLYNSHDIYTLYEVEELSARSFHVHDHDQYYALTLFLFIIKLLICIIHNMNFISFYLVLFIFKFKIFLKKLLNN